MPWGGLLQASDGNFYGTTEEGGARGDGTIFRVTPGGEFTTIYSFCAQPNCTDGASPFAGLIQATDGNLYGTTVAGRACSGGCGTIFKITLDGTLTTLHTLPDGASPQAGLIQATDGNFYGTTILGGAHHRGSIFRITSAGKFTTLHSFQPKTDGMQPYGTIMQATDGNFYGTTYGDGDINSSKKYFGTVYRLSTGLAPFVTTLTPSGSVGASVTILGTNLAGATAVTFNGTPAASFTVNATGSAISTTVPSGATTGSIQVTLSGGGTLSSNLPFQVTP